MWRKIGPKYMYEAIGSDFGFVFDNNQCENSGALKSDLYVALKLEYDNA